MATCYVPGEAGWSDNGTLGDAAKLRVKLTQNYHADTNRSTLTITLQSRCAMLGGRFMLLDNALVKLGGSTVFSGGGSGLSSLGAYVDYAGDEAWHDLTDSATGQPVSWTAELQHDANGDATAALTVTARLYRDDSFYTTFYGLSGSQSLHGDRIFTLTIAAGAHSSVTVKRGGSTLSHGASLTAGDQLTVSFAAEAGYELTEHRLNGQSFTSGGTHTVTGDVSVTAAAVPVCAALLDNGAAYVRCRLLLDTGGAFVPARLFLDRGDRWTEVRV